MFEFLNKYLKKIINNLIGFIIFITITISLFMIGIFAICIIYTYPKLPSLEKITNYKPKSPLKIYSQDGVLLGIYGKEQRSFMQINQFPKNLINAVIAAEDKRFYSHHGIDPIGIIRAFVGNIINKKIRSGASTLTQQVARNFFLGNERTYQRKFNEILLAIKIEKSLTKDQILELYFNQIYLGKRAYGFSAASHTYYNKPVQKLTLAESAILAGLPKGPSRFNPIDNPNRAKKRQLYILSNMYKLNYITQEEYDNAIQEKINYEKTNKHNIDDCGLYIAEMARSFLYDKYGEEIYTSGLKVFTTVNYQNQKVANKALRKTLIANPTNDPFEGAESFIDISNTENINEKIEHQLYYKYPVENLIPAVVLNVDNNSITLKIKDINDNITLTGNSLNYIKPYILNPKYGIKQVQPGAILRVIKNNDQWQISQLPILQGAIVSIDPTNGAIKALIGGFDFYEKQFNRATQAWRQSGSTFKPFIYSAGLEFGLTSASLIADMPITIGKWSPKNSDNKYAGLLTLHQGLIHSKNMVSIRILQAIGINYALDYIQRFGFLKKDQPANLTLTLGSGSTTPIQLAESYAVFANGGYKIKTYFIDKIFNRSGQLIAKTNPLVANQNAKLVIDKRNAFIMYKILEDVIRYGTGRRALELNRTDIAGKTGTTNNQKDAWFVGFNTKVVSVVFIGYDTPKSMGRVGYGGTIAIPVWLNYMKFALKNVPNNEPSMPKDTVKIGDDYFYKEMTSTSPNVKINNSSTIYDPDNVYSDMEENNNNPKNLDNLF